MILRQVARGGRMPERVANAPSLWLGLDLYYVAFWDLSGCRPQGVSGPGPIPWSVTADYARTFDFDDEQRDTLFYLIRRMDAAFLKKGQPEWQPPADSGPSRKGWGS